MERSSWNFHTLKQLVTQNVRINFCPHKPEIQNSETMINLAGTARWQLCGALEEWPANCVLHVWGVLIHCPSDRTRRHTQRRELGGSTCEFNKPSMHSTVSLGLQGCQWACFPPFRSLVYFSRLESNKMIHTEMEHSYFGVCRSVVFWVVFFFFLVLFEFLESNRDPIPFLSFDWNQGFDFTYVLQNFCLKQLNWELEAPIIFLAILSLDVISQSETREKKVSFSFPVKCRWLYFWFRLS